MPHPRLASTVDIELANDNFQTENHAEAAEEILEFYADGVRAFTEMEEQGNWSRSLYQQVYKKYFRAIAENGVTEPESATGSGSDVRAEYRQGYRDGWSDAMDKLADRLPGNEED